MELCAKPEPVELDSGLLVFYLEVPRHQVVLLQAYFELYDGIGTVRTLEGPQSIVSVLTNPSQKQDCIGVLDAIREHVEWQVCREIPDDRQLRPSPQQESKGKAPIS